MLGFRRRAADPRFAELRALSLFSELSIRELKLVQGILHEREYLAGEVIFDEGEEGNALYIVRSGRVLICRQGRIDDPIAKYGTGSFFGELALLESVPRTAQARAIEPSRLAVLFGSDFLALLQRESHLGNRVLLQFARHLGRRYAVQAAARNEA